MDLTFLPLLQVQRDLYSLPRGRGRFEEYLRALRDPRTGDLKLPLVAMNPMGKEHLAPFLDRLLALDAEGIGARAVAEAQAALPALPGSLQAGFVVADDLRGGWTNRAASEFSQCFRPRALLQRGWITAALWTSETYDPPRLREEMLLALHRAAHVLEHGEARTLAQALRQEGAAARRAGVVRPRLAAAELGAVRAALAPFLERTEEPILIAALYGDDAARELGFQALGVRGRAGLSLAD